MYSTALVISNFINVIKPSLELENTFNVVDDVVIPQFYEKVAYSSFFLTDESKYNNIYVFVDGSVLICDNKELRIIPINNFLELKFFLSKCTSRKYVNNIIKILKNMMDNFLDPDFFITDNDKKNIIRQMCKNCFECGK